MADYFIDSIKIGFTKYGHLSWLGSRDGQNCPPLGKKGKLKAELLARRYGMKLVLPQLFITICTH